MCSTNILIKMQNDNPQDAVAKHLMSSNYISSKILIW